jgi:2-dehydro-3-deoxygalactonokinase
MGWSEGFIAVDWGTTNRRAYLVDQEGLLADEMEDGKGILSVPSGGFPQAVEEIRARLGPHPMMLAGMVGSNRGWIEAPYVDCPAGAEGLAASLKWAEPGRCAIVPGVCDRRGDAADVMRGDEVQVVGAVAAGLIAADGYLCHPGTHNKWVRLRGGRIESFRTVMTGELFSLLKKHSILADLLAGEVALDDRFEQGVRRGLDGDDLLAELFSIRARVLLGKAQASSAGSFASGLLIGSDLRLGLRGAQEAEIVVMGRPELTRLFAAAVAIAGRKAREVDGEEAFLAGARHLAELVQ